MNHGSDYSVLSLSQNAKRFANPRFCDTIREKIAVTSHNPPHNSQPSVHIRTHISHPRPGCRFGRGGRPSARTHPPIRRTGGI